MKLIERIYRAPTQLNVSSPETSLIVEVDAVHFSGRQYCCIGKARDRQFYRGLRQEHGIRCLLRELGRSVKLRKRYAETSGKMRGLAKGLMEVGLINSTRRTGKPATRQEFESPARGSDQQRCNAARCKAGTQRSETRHG